MLLLPIVHWQMGVLQLVPIWAIIWTLHAVETLFAASTGSTVTASTSDESSTPNSPVNALKLDWVQTIFHSLNLAGPIGLAFWISVHQGVLLTITLILVAAPMCIFYWDRSKVLPVCLSAVFLAILVGPLIWKHYQVSKNHDFRRDKSVVQSLSAEVADYSLAYGRGVLNNDPERRPWYLGLGLTKTAIAIVALIMVLVRSSRWTVFLALLGTASVLLSMGANLQLGGYCLWDTLSSWIPGVAQVRSVYRFAFIAQVAFVLLGVDLLNRMLVRSESFKKTWLKSLGWLGCSALILAFAIDPLPHKAKLAVTPPLNDEWTTELNSLEAGPVLILPIAFEGEVRDYERTAQWMNQLLESGKPLVNGYSGFFPASFNRIAEELSVQGLTVEAEKQLLQIGVRYVVVQPYYNERASEVWSRYRLRSDPKSSVRIYDLTQTKFEGE
ncbi:MAG: hypothetical protein U0930_03850 [Pirellulales bacterium]